LLALTISLVIFRVALLAGHSNQVALKFVNWKSYSDLDTVVKQQSKPLLLYFVGEGTPKTELMDDTVFSNKMVAECILNDFYPIRVEGGANAAPQQKLIIKKLYKKYLVVQIPTLVVTTTAGSEVSHANGYKPSAQTYQFLRTVKDGIHLKEVEDSDRSSKKEGEDSERAVKVDAVDSFFSPKPVSEPSVPKPPF
jgi:thioredoxin-related protein